MSVSSLTPGVPYHHVSDEQLLDHAAGTASDAASLAIACHLALCPGCAAQASALDAVGGAFLAAADGGGDLAPGALEQTLARLDPAPQPKDVARPKIEAPTFLQPFDLPRALLTRISMVAERAIGWRTLVPGVRAVDLSAGPSEATVRIVAFRSGVTIPLHDHGGAEYIVVFTGALEETGMRFARGDISIRMPGEHHEQHAAPGEACIALVVNEGRLKPLTLRGRLLLALARG